MQTIERPQTEEPTIHSLQAEVKVLRQQVEKLAEENADLLKKLAAVQVAKRPR